MGLSDFVTNESIRIQELERTVARLQGGDAPSNLLPRRDYVPNTKWAGPAEPVYGTAPGSYKEYLEIHQNRDAAIEALYIQSNLVSQFWYTLSGIALASGGLSGQQTIRCDNDSFFICTHLQYNTNLPAAAAPLMPFTFITWTREGSGALLSSAATPVAQMCMVTTLDARTVASHDREPFEKPVIWVPSDTMTFALADRGTGLAQVVDITAQGYKFYMRGPGLGVGG